MKPVYLMCCFLDYLFVLCWRVSRTESCRCSCLPIFQNNQDWSKSIEWLKDNVNTICEGLNADSDRKCKGLYKTFQRVAKKSTAAQECRALGEVSCHDNVDNSLSVADPSNSNQPECAGYIMKSGGLWDRKQKMEKITISRCLELLIGSKTISIGSESETRTEQSRTELYQSQYDNQIIVDANYILELQSNFAALDFERVGTIQGMYITNPINKSTANDMRIFRETQIKRAARTASPRHKKKLRYFYQNEDQDERKIYEPDTSQNLQPDEKYAIQNIGHATVLIQIPGINVLTDPVFYDLNIVLYPAKTESRPSITELPRVDVILISHNHRDHLDEKSLKTIFRCYQERNWAQPRVFVPMGDKKLLRSFGFNQVEEAEWFTKISITNAQQTVNFISIPSDHRSGRAGFDHHKSLVTGWVISPEQEHVIFKYSGDTRSLSDKNQQSVDAVLWNEINSKKTEERKIPDIIFLEPSGPNYTRSDMDVTHQSASYSALLKFIEAENLSKLSGKPGKEFLEKIKTIMVHHNKFELGPDRFNEGLFVLKKLLNCLDLDEENLSAELKKQKEKLDDDLDKQILKKNTCFMFRVFIAGLPKQSSLSVHAKDFIIGEMLEVFKKLEVVEGHEIKDYLIRNTVFPKIGQRLNREQVLKAKFDVENVQKYRPSTQ